jgi:hypothetical protein
MEKSVQCEAILKNGRCKRTTKDISKRCHHHKSNLEPVVIEIHDTSTLSIQCEYTLKNGNQCKKRTKDVSKRCSTHKESVDTDVLSTIITISDDVVNRKKSIRCMERLKNGEQCKKTTKDLESKKCHHHINRSTSIIPVSHHEIQPSLSSIHNRLSDCTKKKDKVVSKKQIGTPESLEKDCHQHEVSEECCVCYDSVPSSELLKCSHPVCKSCIKNLRDPRCPMCRTEIDANHITNRDKRRMSMRRTEDVINRNTELLSSFINSITYHV